MTLEQMRELELCVVCLSCLDSLIKNFPVNERDNKYFMGPCFIPDKDCALKIRKEFLEYEHRRV